MAVNTGKCPKCEQILQHVDVEAIEIHKDLKRAFHGASFLCPHCHSILSVELDPIALTADMAKTMAERLKKG